MSYIDDASNDYLWWENSEAVTVTYKRSSGDTADAVGYSQRLDPSEAQQDFSGVNVNGESLVWNLPAELLDETPAIDDTITDSSSTTWTIRSVQTVRFSSQFVCLTERQR